MSVSFSGFKRVWAAVSWAQGGCSAGLKILPAARERGAVCWGSLVGHEARIYLSLWPVNSRTSVEFCTVSLHVYCCRPKLKISVARPPSWTVCALQFETATDLVPSLYAVPTLTGSVVENTRFLVAWWQRAKRWCTCAAEKGTQLSS